jgi:hypothetical protein
MAVIPSLRGKCRAPPAPRASIAQREPWSPTSLREKLIKIGAKVASRGRCKFWRRLSTVAVELLPVSG